MDRAFSIGAIARFNLLHQFIDSSTRFVVEFFVWPWHHTESPLGAHDRIAHKEQSKYIVTKPFTLKRATNLRQRTAIEEDSIKPFVPRVTKPLAE